MDPIMYLPIFVAASEATKNDAPTEEVKYICVECGKAIMEPGGPAEALGLSDFGVGFVCAFTVCFVIWVIYMCNKY